VRANHFLPRCGGGKNPFGEEEGLLYDLRTCFFYPRAGTSALGQLREKKEEEKKREKGPVAEEKHRKELGFFPQKRRLLFVRPHLRRKGKGGEERSYWGKKNGHLCSSCN